MKKIRLFSMFSGYGGAEWGLKKSSLNFEVVGFSEIKKSAIKCYVQNFPNIKNFGDVTKINPLEIPDFDLLCAGFPCQDVSSAGERDLKKGRTILYKEILRIAEIKKPMWMLLENVEGLLNHNDGHTLIDIKNGLKKIGYDVQYKLLSSEDYGIPHNRKRVFFICRKKPFEFMESYFPEKWPEKTPLSDIIKKGAEDKYYIDEEKKKKLNNQERFDDSWVVFQKHQSENRIYNKFMPCFTCVDTSNIYIIEDVEKIRQLTINECMQLMGFEKGELKYEGLSKNHMYDLFGDGWDVHLVSLIFKKMFAEQKSL